MKQILFMLFIWTILCLFLPTFAIADSDRPQPDGPDIEQQVQRIRNARRELDEQRYQLEMERQELERQRDQLASERQERSAGRQMDDRGDKPIVGVMIVVCLVVHILVAIWVYQDIRIRGTGSGIWIVIALLAGLAGVLVYAIVRLGDVKQS